MDNNIVEKFKEKNSEILINKYMQDIDNNDYILKLSLDYKIPFSSKILAQSINKFLKQNNINDYEFKDLSEKIDKISNNIKEEVFKLLDKRKERIKEEIKSNEEIDEENLIDTLNNIFLELKKELDVIMNTIIYVGIPEALKSVFKVDTEEKYDSIISSLLSKFDKNISHSIEDSIEGRNLSLKNTLLETHDKVSELNNITETKYSK